MLHVALTFASGSSSNGQPAVAEDAGETRPARVEKGNSISSSHSGAGLVTDAGL